MRFNNLPEDLNLVGTEIFPSTDADGNDKKIRLSNLATYCVQTALYSLVGATRTVKQALEYLKELIDGNTENISTNTENIATNAGNIANISERSAQNKTDITTINNSLSGTVAFDCTRNTTNTNAGAARGIYEPATGLVTINVWWQSASAVASGNELFNVPAAYRPASTRQGACITFNGATIAGTGNCSITPAGIFAQGASNSVTRGIAMISYKK